jgi:hypothetical protein
MAKDRENGIRSRSWFGKEKNSELHSGYGVDSKKFVERLSSVYTDGV